MVFGVWLFVRRWEWEFFLFILIRHQQEVAILLHRTLNQYALIDKHLEVDVLLGLVGLFSVFPENLLLDSLSHGWPLNGVLCLAEPTLHNLYRVACYSLAACAACAVDLVAVNFTPLSP